MTHARLLIRSTGLLALLAALDVAHTPPAARAQDAPVVAVKAWITPAVRGKSSLVIQATIKEGWHIYSITQPKGGPVRTKITLAESKAFQLGGEYRAKPAPKVHFDDIFKINLEEHSGTVTWTAPLELAAGTDLRRLRISGKVNAQACNEQTCLPPENFSFTAALAERRR